MIAHAIPTALVLAVLLPACLHAQEDAAGGLFAAARQLPLVAQSVVVHVDGAEARVELTQVFANDGGDHAQADYRLHLPREATVSAFGFWRGGRFLAAELREREEARAAHAVAAAEGRATALLQRDGTVHSFSVFPIAAGGLQRVGTTLHLPVATERGRSSVRLPFDAFLGHATLVSTALVHLATPEPLRAMGVDGAEPRVLEKGARKARLAFSANGPVDLWWAEEAPPLLARAEAVPLGDGSFAVQVRLALNDAGKWAPPHDELVLLVDASASMRRRSAALGDLLARLGGRSKTPVRVVAVAGTDREVDVRDPRAAVREVFAGAAFGTTWDDLVFAAGRAGCDDPRRRCLVVTDPQVTDLPAERPASLATLFLADADELAHFGGPSGSEILGKDAAVHQPGIDPAAHLAALADEQVLPLLEVVTIDQRGGTLELLGDPKRRVALGGLLRLHATSRSEEELALGLDVAGRRVEKSVPVDVLDADGRPGRALRRAHYATLLDGWVADYRRERSEELRLRIVDVSLREGIPTALTALHATELPPTATPAPLLRLLGVALLVAAWAVYPRSRRVA